MAKLKLGPITDDKPVTIKLPAQLHQDLAAYAEALGREQSQSIAVPVKPMVPMLVHILKNRCGLANELRNLGSTSYGP